ncbi:uncharacterized protein LOC125583248 [Brassica napus]|uniref:uncharacterized protein LOC125583248 n=1 Tax=Brassica napus TaxID=3708 RepID=UPI002079D04D|nr:uncharacterized protein LOC125583248 [Brassica napus]
MSIATDRNFKDAIIKFRKAVCLPPSGVSGNILPWVCWALWIARNTLIFEDQLSTPEETATRAIRSAQEWGLAQGLKDQIPKRAENQPNLKQHQPERNTIMVCKSDAAWDNGSNKAGLAWILTDASEICKHRGATTQDFVSSPLIAEALALRLGIISAAAMEISDLQMLSDNQTVIKAINNDIQNPEIYGIVKDIQKISSGFVDITFSFVSRVFNGETDALAKTTLNRSSVMDP